MHQKGNNYWFSHQKGNNRHVNRQSEISKPWAMKKFLILKSAGSHCRRKNVSNLQTRRAQPAITSRRIWPGGARFLVRSWWITFLKPAKNASGWRQSQIWCCTSIPGNLYQFSEWGRLARSFFYLYHARVIFIRLWLLFLCLSAKLPRTRTSLEAFKWK